MIKSNLAFLFVFVGIFFLSACKTTTSLHLTNSDSSLIRAYLKGDIDEEEAAFINCDSVYFISVNDRKFSPNGEKYDDQSTCNVSLAPGKNRFILEYKITEQSSDEVSDSSETFEKPIKAEFIAERGGKYSFQGIKDDDGSWEVILNDITNGAPTEIERWKQN